MKTTMTADDIIDLLEAKRAIYQDQASRATSELESTGSDFARHLKTAAGEKVKEYDSILRDIEIGLKVAS